MQDKEEFVVEQHAVLPHESSKFTLGNFIFHLLFHRKPSHSKLLSTHNLSEEEENKFIHRGMLFVSFLIQVFLRLIARPLKLLGTILERFLNRKLIAEAGKRGIKINRQSPGYLTYLGHLDPRMQLDKEIKAGDDKYYPALSMMAAKVAYENEFVIEKVVSQWNKVEFVEFHNFYNEFQNKWTTQAFICHDHASNTIAVSFRGTSTFIADDWSTDFDFSWCTIKGMGKLHRGFLIALGLKKYEPDEDNQGDYYGYWPKEIQQDDNYPLAYYTIRKKLKEMMGNDKETKFIVTGHSLGGALAVLFPSILALHGEKELLDRLEGIYTYGQPRVGDETFGEFMKTKLREHQIKYYRIVYCNDIVPHVPFDNTLMMFKHFGTCIHFNSFYHAKVTEEETARHGSTIYLFLTGIVKIILALILARLNAMWELIRGFIIGHIAGPDYKEGWFQMVARLLALIVPGAMNHFPRDYVNSTRLASKDLFKNYDAINM